MTNSGNTGAAATADSSGAGLESAGSAAAGSPAQVLPFGAGMTRPVQLGGGTPEYTSQARAARVEGKVMARCVIRASGVVDDCQVLRGVPMLNEIVLEHLQKSRFQPVTYQGQPRAIRYVFSYSFALN